MKEVDKIRKQNENKINWLHHAGCKRRKVKFLCETKCAATYESTTLWNILAIKHGYVPYCPGWQKYANMGSGGLLLQPIHLIRLKVLFRTGG